MPRGADPRLSVIVPLYGGLALTQAMVASLRATLPREIPHEIILVDDGSTDGTREWLATLAPPCRVILNPGNLGYAEANNRGAAGARGELLALLNNDLVLTPHWLEPMLAAHRRLGPRAGVVGNVQLSARTGEVDHAGIFINWKGKPEHCRRGAGPLARLFRPDRSVVAVTGACFLIARSLWRELGGFDSGYRNGGEDVDLCFRAAAAGRRHLVARRSRVLHHVSSAPGRKARDEANTYRLVEQWHDTIVRLGRDDWCRHHFETFLPEPRDFPDPALARQVALYLLGLRVNPPAGATAGMRQTVATELARWQQMFAGDPSRLARSPERPPAAAGSG
jgi:GT2 family glycosyltransferase